MSKEKERLKKTIDLHLKKFVTAYFKNEAEVKISREVKALKKYSFKDDAEKAMAELLTVSKVTKELLQQEEERLVFESMKRNKGEA
ncbi:hypothetical protein [Sediminitomix flava]|uniref:Uncharacterized protein n=1 Tax=Sediminitomix flava TaxID=379075 RepID=A0A315Z948_SEDFL|nr:hypothetical protein [Sediminitomix flava]PWJ42096.1 hypothetical protein BC781_103346 [Sediminitomix flava]